MKEEVLAAFCDIRPFPAWLEIGSLPLRELLYECRGDEFEFGTRGLDKFCNVKVVERKFLVGWRVMSTLPSEEITEETFSTATVTVDNRGKEVRNYVTSPDFDEAEQLRYEEHNRRRGR